MERRKNDAQCTIAQPPRPLAPSSFVKLPGNEKEAACRQPPFEH